MFFTYFGVPFPLSSIIQLGGNISVYCLEGSKLGKIYYKYIFCAEFFVELKWIWNLFSLEEFKAEDKNARLLKDCLLLLSSSNIKLDFNIHFLNMTSFLNNWSCLIENKSIKQCWKANNVLNNLENWLKRLNWLSFGFKLFINSGSLVKSLNLFKTSQKFSFKIMET